MIQKSEESKNLKTEPFGIYEIKIIYKFYFNEETNAIEPG
jgi:hypothetical protein